MKLLVTGAWKCTDEQLNDLVKLGHSVVFMQNENEDLPCEYSEVEGAICNGLFLHHQIEKFTSLKFIQLTSAGFDRVPMDYVELHGIKIYNARGVYSIPMAEFAISGVLQLYKQAPFFMDKQKNSTWEKHRGILELYSKKVCIIGCGNVGTECAKRFNAFGCSVFGVDMFPRIDENYKEMYALDSIDKALSSADVVVLTLPLTNETKHMINDDRLGVMKNGSVLVNIARGPIIEEQALIKALKTKLLGAVLDVFEQEPLSKDSPLWQIGNAILTPHNSFVGDGNAKRLEILIKENIVSYEI